MTCGERRCGRCLSGPKATAFETLERRALLSAAVARTDLATFALNPDAIGGTATVPRGAKTPAQVRQAYGLSDVSFGGVNGDGSGQTIAIIDAYDDPTALADINAFSAAFGLTTFNSGGGTPTFKKVNEDGGSSLPEPDPDGPGDNSWELEEALDIEWAHASAPGANITLVEADSSFDDDLIQSAVAYARGAPGVSVVSMSFGGDQQSDDASNYDRYFTTPGGHNGVTFLASSGDDGAPGGYPAYSANVVAVGGTSLTLSGSGGYGGETGWSGSGGGVSDTTPQPAYQKGVVTQSTDRRTIPDVSMLADPNTGVAVYDSYDFGTTTPWLRGYEGGTSLATPLWAGVIAIADQGRAANGLSTLDGATQALPALYAAPQGDFHDITSGNNGQFSAGPGYDLVTGRGTPVGNALLPYLAGYGGTTTTATASIRGRAFNDTNADGVQNGTEAGAAGKTVFLDANDNGKLDAGEKSTVTAGDGSFAFTGLAAGTYHVRRVFPGGYTYSTTPIDLTLTARQAVSGVTIGSRTTTPTGTATASLAGYTFDDTNADGVLDDGESKSSGKTVFLDANNNGKLDAGEKSVKTASDGSWGFAGLAAGSYYVRKVFPSGYTYSTTLIDVTLTAGEKKTGLSIGSKRA